MLARASHFLSLATLSLLLTGAASASDETMNQQLVLSTISQMTDAFAQSDIEGVMSTYAPGAVVVGSPGAPVQGDSNLRDMFAEFIAAGVQFRYGAHEVVVSGDTALHLMQWTAPSPEGDQTALSVAVLKLQADGTWKMVIDHPFGDGVMHTPVTK